MQRIALSEMILSLSLFCYSGVLMASEADELREKAKAMRKEASALIEKGDREQAEKLEKNSVKILEAAERMELKGKERREQRDRPDIDKEVRHLKERLNDLVVKERKMGEAQAPKQELPKVREKVAGVREQVAGIERELNAIHSQHADKAELPPEFRPQAEKLEAVARRIHHMRVAAENLKMAEAHDFAHQLMEKSEGMEREYQAGKQRLAAEMHKHFGGNDGLAIGRDLRVENERLRAEVKELRQMFEKR